MKLIVGLGNPDKEYDNTRHNIGFQYIEKYGLSKSIRIDKKKFNGLYNEFKFNNEKVILLKPLLYMNLSGIVVKKYMDYFNIDISDILIISDDLDMPIGRIKLRQNGTSGGHKGLKNIEDNVGTTEYKRLKIGISNNKNISTKDYVLGEFSSEEENIIDSLDDKIINILNDYLVIKFDDLMSKYNQK